jgi:FAD:protein FMN transferase
MCALVAVLTGCVTERRASSRFEYTRPQMGVPFRIVLYASDKNMADAAAEAAFARVQQLNDTLSDYDTDSELSRLSQTSGQGKVVPVSDDLWRMLERAQQLARETDGAFDITCGPVVSLWRKARREKKLPDPLKLEEARRAVGYDKLELDARKQAAQLKVPYMRLDLGAIAKGYAVDEALRVLRARGIRSALVAGAGDMSAGDAPPGAKGWRIEIAPLDVTNAPPAKFVLLRHRALAMSGDVFQHVEIGGIRYSHIVDPRTGVGLTDHSLVVAIAKDCTTANTVATSVSVMGPTHGMEFAESKGACVRVVRKPSEEIEVRESKCFQQSVAQ